MFFFSHKKREGKLEREKEREKKNLAFPERKLHWEFPLHVSPPSMGCGVSKFDHAAGGGGWRQLSIVHKKSDAAVVDNILLSKSLPEGREGEAHAKGRGMHKKANSDEKGGMQRGRLQSSNKGESLEDDGYIPQSLSFRVYCISSLEDDNNQGNPMPLFIYIQIKLFDCVRFVFCNG